MREEIGVGTDAYTQEELLAAIRGLMDSFASLLYYARQQEWDAYRSRMRRIDLQYRQLRSQGPGLGARPTRQ